jgi:S-adenosylmethionine:diacylglycerol 3-amino-3-carboxypropyl transferase
LNLARLKLAAALHLEIGEAVRFIGYAPCPAQERRRAFSLLSRFLSGPERTFWGSQPAVWEKGPVLSARFEKYLSRFNGIGIRLLGRKNLMGLFECDDVPSQRDHFDRHLNSHLLKRVFQLAFHPKIYKKRGMDAQGMVHEGQRNIAEFFFSRFRNFCTSTLARSNYFLQFALFNRLLFPEALPEYLTKDGNRRLRKRAGRLSFRLLSITEAILSTPPGYYQAFALSNVGDWMTQDEFARLLELMGERSARPGRALVRYIHLAHPIPGRVAGTISCDERLGEELESVDRYPFYGLRPMRIAGRG